MTDGQKLNFSRLKKAKLLAILETEPADEHLLELGKTALEISRIQKKINNENKNFTEED